ARAEQHRVLNAMLVLCAEHELNASSFTARCAASAGASPYATVNAGMCALRGPKHAGATLAVEELLEAVAKSGDATAVVTHYLAQGRSVPGFGHRVYRDLDPRAAILFEMIESLPGGSKEMRRVSQLIHTMALGTGLKANLDLALVACSRALGAPASTSLHIFCLARVAGFIAHTIEQYQDGRLLRPRAEFER
ncbi:MAG: citrate/2-methylcitrate synthase, partial [Candidatus Methylacidiphilales bacterium]